MQIDSISIKYREGIIRKICRIADYYYQTCKMVACSAYLNRTPLNSSN